MAVAIMPGLFVAVVAAGRNQLIQRGRHVSLQPGLELNHTDRLLVIEVSSFEQSWLRPSLFRFAKIAQTDPYKTKALLRTKVYSFSQL